jgi:PAS domain S-box-containing protein
MGLQMTGVDSYPVRGRPRTVFLTVAIVLIVSVCCAHMMGNAALRANRAVTAQQSVIDHLNQTLATLSDAETGQRGFLLSGEDRYLDPYNAAVSRIRGELRSLDDLAETEDLSAANVSRFKELTGAKLAELEHTIGIRRSQGFAAAVAEVHTHVGKELMDQLRALSATMVATEYGDLREHQRHAAALDSARSAVFFTAAFVNLGFLAWAYRRIQREITQRETAAAELFRQKELLAVTLASIGDGVIVTDALGNITFLNEVAERLTGWNSADALGQSCGKVFNIINESTRDPVESPVEKVLRSGVVVGLANHTLLIRKDGTELPIDDSGAPVRDREGIVRGVVLIFRDFTEHKRSEMDLIQAKESAEEANIAKDNFLATLSHELRTPLTPVLTTLAAWETSSDLPAELLADVQMMRRNIDLEARLIDDLLDLTRIVRGKLSLNPEVADVHDLIRSVTGIYHSEIRSKRLEMGFKLDAPLHHVFADPARLQQVFWNILKNATKFTAEGGRIEITTSNPEPGRARITFTDNGIGMNAELLEKLFLPFEQGTSETVRRYGGLGLGLAISKALMDAQGGSIAAHSSGPGLGSTFTVELPAMPAPIREAKPAVKPPAPADLASALSILLVEDHADTARVMSRLLRLGGHHVHVAATVASALDAVAANSIGLIISDIGLPDGTGIDLIQTVRKTSNVPAIALTGFGMDDDVAKCRDAGFNDHLTKPVNLQKLELAIRQLTNRPK